MNVADGGGFHMAADENPAERDVVTSIKPRKIIRQLMSKL